jgi:hypothetical protein
MTVENVPTVSTSNKEKIFEKIYFFGIFKASDEKSRIRIWNQVYGSGSVSNVRDPEHYYLIHNAISQLIFTENKAIHVPG